MSSQIKQIMSEGESQQQIHVTGPLLALNVFEEKLMRNFFIIDSRLKKLDQIADLDRKIKVMDKELKFVGSKVEVISERVPKEPPVSRDQIRSISKDQLLEILNSKDDRLGSTKFAERVMQEIKDIRMDITRIRVAQADNPESDRKDPDMRNRPSLTNSQPISQPNRLSMPKECLEDCLDKQEYDMVNMINKEGNGSVLDEINSKFEDVYEKLEEIKFERLFKNGVDKQLERFGRYEHFEQKSQDQAKKNKDKPIRMDGITKQDLKGELLKRDLYSEYQKSEALRNQPHKTVESNHKVLPSIKQSQTAANFRNEVREGVKRSDLVSEVPERLRPCKSVRKLDRLQRRLKVDDIKELNGVLREIELRIEGRVSHDIFIGFVEDIEEKLEILRITKDPSNQLGELRKMVYTLETKFESILALLQHSINNDDALLVKKQWTCISCDKNIDRYNGKVGQHLNWDSMNSRKISPSKVGAFGQTGQLANKIRNLMENHTQ